MVSSSRALLKKRFGFAALFWFLCVSLIFLYCFLPFAEKTLIESGDTFIFVLKTVLIAFTCLGLLAAIFAVCYSCERSFFVKAQGEDAGADELFYFFRPSKFFSALRFFAGAFIIRLVILLFCSVPVCAVAYMLYSALKNSADIFLLCVLSVLVFACAVCSVLTYGKISRLLFLSRYLFFITEKGGALSLFLMSANKMEKYTKKLFRLKLSLFPYKLLCLFILPIGYVVFLHRQSYALLAKEITQESVEKKEDS